MRPESPMQRPSRCLAAFCRSDVSFCRGLRPLRCAADCVPGSAQVIDDMMSGSTRTKLNARALIFVVDLILKRGMRQNPPPERNYAVMAKVMVPHLSKWLRVLLLTKRSPEQLEKTRKMISRWSDDGYLPMDGVLPLIELMDGGLPPVSEDSQQSQQSLDFSQSQPLPWSSPQRKEELRPGAGPSAPVPDTKQPQPAPAAPAAPAPAAPAPPPATQSREEPPSKRVKRLSSSELPSREAEADLAEDPFFFLGPFMLRRRSKPKSSPRRGGWAPERLPSS